MTGPAARPYAFHCCRRDGVAVATARHSLPAGVEVLEHALRLLDEHPGADYVAVFYEDRLVLTRRRVHADLRAVLGRGPAARPAGGEASD